MKKHICLVVLALAATATFAQQTSSKLGFVGALGANFGGDTLVSGNYSNGGSYSIKSGKGLMLAGGVTYAVDPTIDVQATIGYENDSTNASNGEIKFTRTPMEVLGFYNFNDAYRLGLGLRRACGAHLSSSGAAASVGSEDFDASTGAVLEGQYLFGQKNTERKARFGLYARYVAEKFTSQKSSKTVSGNHIGLGVVTYF